MAKTGIQVKSSTLKQQRENAELELIIEDFARGMRNADRAYIASGAHYDGRRFTPNLARAWMDYVYFCVRTTENGKK